MDRLTTGRRHVRAGSVHVTELINKQVTRPGVPAPLANSAVATRPRPELVSRLGYQLGFDPVAEELDPVHEAPTSHRRPPSRGAQLAKLTSLGAATLVLCGAVAAATMISHQRPDQDVAERPAIRITGDQALLPDQLDRTLPSASGRPAPAPTPPRATERPVPPAPQAPPRTAAEAPPAASPDQTEPADPAPPSAAAPMSDVALVKQFYRLLASDPDGAFDLIAPNLLTTTLGEFLQSWSTVRGIHVDDVHPQAGGVHAVVRMTLADGGHLRIEQLLTVADSPRRITGVQLLSAQRN